MRTITTKIIAHRGASGLVKVGNTLEAFQKAIEVKADGIELDLRKFETEYLKGNVQLKVFHIKIGDKIYKVIPYQIRSR